MKIDIVRDTPPYFGEPNAQPDGVIVDSLENIAVGKLLAVYGRAYPRDFVDLYFLLKSGLDFGELVALGKAKDAGLIDFYLAGMLRQIAKVEEKDLPVLLKPLDFDEMKRFFLNLADELMRKLKPEDVNG